MPSGFAGSPERARVHRVAGRVQAAEPPQGLGVGALGADAYVAQLALTPVEVGRNLGIDIAPDIGATPA